MQQAHARHACADALPDRRPTHAPAAVCRPSARPPTAGPCCKTASRTRGCAAGGAMHKHAAGMQSAHRQRRAPRHAHAHAAAHSADTRARTPWLSLQSGWLTDSTIKNEIERATDTWWPNDEARAASECSGAWLRMPGTVCTCHQHHRITSRCLSTGLRCMHMQPLALHCSHCSHSHAATQPLTSSDPHVTVPAGGGGEG